MILPKILIKILHNNIESKYYTGFRYYSGKLKTVPRKQGSKILKKT